jgi:hypothetical protein
MNSDLAAELNVNIKNCDTPVPVPNIEYSNPLLTSNEQFS